MAIMTGLFVWLLLLQPFECHLSMQLQTSQPLKELVNVLGWCRNNAGTQLWQSHHVTDFHTDCRVEHLIAQCVGQSISKLVHLVRCNGFPIAWICKAAGTVVLVDPSAIANRVPKRLRLHVGCSGRSELGTCLGYLLVSLTITPSTSLTAVLTAALAGTLNAALNANLTTALTSCRNTNRTAASMPAAGTAFDGVLTTTALITSNAKSLCCNVTTYAITTTIVAAAATTIQKFTIAAVTLTGSAVIIASITRPTMSAPLTLARRITFPAATITATTFTLTLVTLTLAGLTISLAAITTITTAVTRTLATLILTRRRTVALAIAVTVVTVVIVVTRAARCRWGRFRAAPEGFQLKGLLFREARKLPHRQITSLVTRVVTRLCPCN